GGAKFYRFALRAFTLRPLRSNPDASGFVGGQDNNNLPVRLLVKSELVTDRIGKDSEGAHLPPNLFARRGHLPATLLNLLQRLRDAVHHDVSPSALIGCSIAFFDPGATHTAGVIEGQVSVAALPHFPTENLRVELRGVLGAIGWNFKITNLPMGH